MSTIKSFNDALDFYPADTREPGRLVRFGTTLRIYWDALHEGLQAARSYNELTRRGVPHDEAVHKVMGEHFSA